MSIEDPRLSSIDNTSAADDFDSAVEQHLGFVSESVDGIEVAQAETPDAGRTDRLPVQTAAATIPAEVAPDQNNVVTLPAGIELDNLEFRVDGANLVLVLADGTEVVVLGGAANIPTFVIGDVELPQVALFAALEGSNINVAAGPDGNFSAQAGSPSNGGDFNDDPFGPPPADLALADLLGDTAFGDELRTGTVEGDDGEPSIPFPLGESFIYDEAVIAGGEGLKIITGTLPFDPGPDFGTISGIGFAGAGNVDEEGLGPQTLPGFTSGGRPITVTSFPAPTDGADLDFLALEGRDSEGNLVFTITITNRITGDFTFELVGKLEHPDAGADGAQDDMQDLLRLGFTYTVTDLDGDSVTGSFNIDVMDDAPTIGAPVDGSVDEDDLFSKFDDWIPEARVAVLADGPSDGDSDYPMPFSYPTATGSLAIRWGADDDLKSETLDEEGQATGDDPVGRTLGFTGLNTESTSEEIQAAIPDLANLTSDGFPLSYRIEYTRDAGGNWNGGYRLIAFKDNGYDGDDGEVQYKAAALADNGEDFLDEPRYPIYKGEDETVFTITLDPTTATGTYTFQLIGNLDHYTGREPVEEYVDQSDEGSRFVKLDSDLVEVDELFLDIPFTATDSDGDSVDGTVTVNVVDDEPVLIDDRTVTATIDEDDIDTAGSVGTSPNDGNADGSYTGPWWSNTSGPATVSGYLNSLVDFGADNRYTHFSITDDGAALQTLVNLNLTSKGEEISYEVRFGTLYAYVNNDETGAGYGEGDRLVFSLNVYSYGEYKFELYDQLDHDLGADQNNGLQGSDATAINFGAIVKATDFDGDSVSLDGAFSITVTDDVPELSGAKEVRIVDEDDISTMADGLPGGSLGTSPEDNNTVDGSYTGSPSSNTTGPAFISGSLSNLIKGGADDTVKFTFINEVEVRAALTSLGLTSKGGTLSFDLQGKVLYGFVDADLAVAQFYQPANGDRPVFKLTLNENGSYEFELLDQLDHDLGAGQNTGLQGSDANAIDFGAVIQATDFDGDSLSLKGAFSITVTDDAPELSGKTEARIVDEDDISTMADGLPGGSLGTSPEDNNTVDGSYTGSPSSNTTGPAFISGSLSNLIKGGADDTVKFTFIDEVAVRAALTSLGLTSKGGNLSFDLQGKVLYGFVDADLAVAQFYQPANGDRPVFKLTLNENGSYEFELLDQLDHDLGGGQNTGLQGSDANAINFGAVIQATDHDGDSVSLNNAFSITITDDVPVLSGTKENRTVDEDDIATSQSTGTSPDDDNTVDGSYTGNPISNPTGPAFISGSLGNLIKGGADDTVKFSFIDEAVLRQSLAGLGMSSKGEVLSFDLQGNVLYGFANVGGPSGVSFDPQLGDRPVFKLTLNENGSYTFELIDQLDHDLGAGQNTGLQGSDANAINFGAVIQATDHDGDSVSLNNAFSITITDDVPVLSGTKENRLVDEDDIKTSQSTGTNPTDGNGDGSWTGGPGQNGNGPAFIDGSLANLIKGGADDRVKFSFIDESAARAALDNLGLSSKGAELSYDIRDGVLYAFDNAGPFKGESFDADNGDRLVFKLTLNDNGSYTFELVDQLDHDLGKGQNTDLQDDFWYKDVEAIDFGSIIKATDFDGDSVSLGGAFSITIRDDVPELSGSKETRIVDEDDIRTLQSTGNNPNDGDADGSFTGNPIGNNAGPAFVSGSLANLIKGGADDTVKFSFISETAAVSTLAALGLSSKGAELSYDIQGKTLFAYDNDAGNSGYGHGDRLVFKLTLEDNGSYTFELVDQLDHDRPKFGRDENTDLQDDVLGDVEAIDFGSIIKATDFDGDSVVLTNAFSITIRDDVPELSGKTDARIVDEDDIKTSQSTGTSPADFDADGSWTGGPGQGGNGPAFIDGSLACLVKGGADDTIKFSFIDETVARIALSALGLKSQGEALSYQIQGNSLIAYDNNGGPGYGQGDRLVFKLTLNQNGDYTFELADQLDHDRPAFGADENYDLQDGLWFADIAAINFGALIKATDNDGDSISLNGVFEIKIRDDVPEASIVTDQTVTIDETNGNQNSDTTDQAVAAVFAGVSNPASDLDMQQSPIFAKADVIDTTFKSGTDEGVTTTLALRIDNAASGLQTTAGQDITLYLENGLVVGRVGGPQGQAAFAIAIDADGNVSVAQYASLKHPDTTAADEGIDLTGKLSAVFTVKDFDGDVVTKSVSIGNKIAFEDDAPVATGEQASVREADPASGGNLVFAFDVSGSMRDRIGGPGGDTRLQVAKDAAINLINATNAGLVLIVTFAGSASASQWMTKEDALDFIQNDIPNPNGGTDYDDAIDAIKDVTPPSAPTSVYFFSDGEVTGTDKLTGQDRQQWEAYLNQNDMKSYAVGVGNDIDSQDEDLRDVAWPGEPILITSPTDPILLATVVAPVPTTASGNVLENDSFGADGVRIQSITIGGVTYTWDGNATITKSGSETGEIRGFSMTVASPLGGSFTFDFKTGAWSYAAPSELVINSSESFNYILVDGDGDTTQAALTINLEAVNDAPVNTVPSSLTVAEDVELAITGLQVGDVDANGGNLTVKLEVEDGKLTLATSDGVTVAGNNSDTVTLTGSVSAINAALAGLKYKGDLNFNGADQLKITTTDNGNSGVGGAKTDTDTVNITVTPVNDAPLLSPETRTIEFTENGNGRYLFSNVNVSDVDKPSNFNGGTIEISLGNTAVAGDQIFSDGWSRVSGGNVQIATFGGWVTIGTLVSGGLGGTSIKINLTSGATEDRVEFFLETIAYKSTSENPTDADRTVTVTFSDGGNTGAGGSQSDTSMITVKVNPVNDAPVVANAIADQSIQEEGTVNFTVPANAFTDVDSAPLSYTATLVNGNALPSWLTFNAATRTFSGTAPLDYNGAIDVKVTASDGSLSVSDTFKLTVTPVNDAPVVANAIADQSIQEEGTVNFTVPANAFTDVDSAPLSYTATLDNGNALPSWLTFNAATRTFSGTAPLNYNGAIDVKVTASDGSLSVSDTFKLTVNPVNDAPVLSDVGGTLAYTEGDGGKVVDGSITITDIDDANIEGATVKITGNFASGQDVLLFTNQNGISGSYDASNGTLTLSGASSKANYELALESIRYQNTSDNPSSAARTISFSVTDGEATSNIGTVSVSVTPTAGKIEGDEFDNTLSGTTGNDTILGYEGDDDISGGHGNDILAGGLGWDTVSGGNGSDTFILDGSSLAYDVITDFVSAADILNFINFSLANHSGTGAINSVVTINGNGNLGNNSNDTSIAGADLVVLNVNAQDANTASEVNGILDGQRGTFSGGVFVLAYAQYNGANRVALYYDGDADGTFTGARLVAIFPNYNSVTTNGVPNIAADFASISNIADPIILDLDKNGFAFSSIDNGVTFDIDADGKADRIAWTSDDGILAYDVDGNGLIDNGSEIFTPDFNGGKFASGVAALASLDSNGDGKIDASDEAFSKLQIWVDADNDGVSDEGELSSLSGHVASISLTTDQTGGTEDDQTIFAEGEFTFADGSTGNFVEVGFDTIFGSDLTDGLTVIGTDGDDVLHGGMGQVVMTGGAGADTFVFDGTALDELDVADVITDFNSDEGDVLDVTALLDSLLGEQATAETAASHLRATVEDGNTTVSVQTATDTWKDVVTLQGHTESVKILFDDKHAVTVSHD